MKALLVLVLVVVMFSAVFGAMLAAPLAVFPWLAAGPGAAPVPIEAPGVPIDIGAPPGPVVGDVLAVARTWLGVPYLFGGCSRGGIDCSCLTDLVYAALGIGLPRTAQEQWNATSRVDQVALQPGDLRPHLPERRQDHACRHLHRRRDADQRARYGPGRLDPAGVQRLLGRALCRRWPAEEVRLVTIFEYVADMFKRLIAAGIFILLLGAALVAIVGGLLLVGWLLSGARL